MCRVCVWVNFAVGLLPYLYEMRMRACLACPAFGVHTESRWIFQLAWLPPSPSFHHATQPSQLLLLLGGVFKARALTNWKLVKPPEHCPAGEPMYCIRSHTHSYTDVFGYSQLLTDLSCQFVAWRKRERAASYITLQIASCPIDCG